ncbi:MAG: response regulator [bacterium]|jgi:DNA-binding NtrC family response regulator|nr:response regulator [bacterium]
MTDRGAAELVETKTGDAVPPMAGWLLHKEAKKGLEMDDAKTKSGDVKRILIVEDEATLSYFLAYSLMSEAEDYEVVTARDAETAVSKMEEKAFHLLISDIVLPQMDGLTLLRQTQKQWPQTKTILMTAYGSPEVRTRAEAMGAFAYIEKPFVYSRMRDVVLQALHGAEARSTAE